MPPSARAATIHAREYWLCQVAGWGLLAVVTVLASMQGTLESVLRMSLAKLLVAASGLVLSHGWRLVVRRHGWLDRNGMPPLTPLLAGLAACSVLQVGFLVLADAMVRHGQLFDDPGDVPGILLGLFVLWYAVFAIWTLAYAVVLSRRRALRFELEKLELEISVKDAELRALQAQVNPHFFFNSLNSIRALIYQDRDTAAQAVGQLAGMMRYSLRAGQTKTVRLADEVAAVNAYLGMESHRFDDRLQAQVEIAPGLDEVALPPMVLQTLVENAVKHGVERAFGACRLHVAASRAGGQVLLTVANQGRLETRTTSTGLGLANARQRLALLFGARASCTLSEQDGWVTARVVLPQGEA